MSEHRCDDGEGNVEVRREEVGVQNAHLRGAGDNGRVAQPRPREMQGARVDARTGPNARRAAAAVSTVRTSRATLTTDQHNPDNVGELLSRR